MNSFPRLTIRSLKVRALDVIMPRPLETSGGTVGTAPLVLVDLLTEEGITGTSYVFCYTPLALKPVAQLITNLEAVIKGDNLVPLALEQKLQKRFRLLGPQGLTMIAMAGLDMAAWDALATANNLPLARFLGGDTRPVPVYNSCGLGIIGSKRAAREAQELLKPGFRAIKVRLGYPSLKEDVEVVRAIHKAVGDDIVLMSDYNQSLSVPEALKRVRALDDEGLYWIEEPTTADDYRGHARVKQEARTAIQLGENWWGPHDMAKSIEAGSSDFVMADAEKIGGVTGWLRAAALAEAHGLPLSSHLFPEVSAHLLAASPTAHWLEYMDWTNQLLKEPHKIENGNYIPPDKPGTGLDWDEEKIKQFLVE